MLGLFAALAVPLLTPQPMATTINIMIKKVKNLFLGIISLHIKLIPFYA
jgi:hypothetical protein